MKALEENSSSTDKLASLADVAPSIQENTMQGVAGILKHRENNQITENEVPENIGKIQRLGLLISNLTYQEYLVVEDFTRKVREGKIAAHIAQDLGIFLEHDQHDTMALPDGKNDTSDAVREVITLFHDLRDTDGFKDDAVTFVRSVYPFGKNIINREFKPKQPSSIKAKEGTKATFIINNTTATVEVHSGGVCTVNCEGSSKPLQDGKALVIGRPLYKKYFFDQSVEDISGGTSEGIVIIPGLLVNQDDRVSRAGMMIVLKDGWIYAFDRGSKNKFHFSVTQNDHESMSGSYSPDALGDDGMAGKSEMSFIDV